MTDLQMIEGCLTACGVSAFGICPFTPDLLLPTHAKRAFDRQPDLKRAKSVIVCVFPYYVGDFEQRNLSLYAMPPDYHAIILQKLTKAAEALSGVFAGCSFRPYVDVSPLREVQAAVSAGLGVRGFHTQLICEQWGSLVFLGELVTDAALDTTGTGQSRIDCEGCQRCVAACPTGALHDGLLDTAKCRSAITQKKDSLTPWEEEQIALGGLAWGCDICTLACPHNAHIPITPIGEFTRGVSPVLTEQNLDALLMNRAFSWRGKEVLARNLRILAKPTERTTTMTFEVLTPEQYREADDFIQNHPYGSFTQCTRWAQVKSEWGHRTIVSRLPSGIITGALLVLMRPIPFLKTVMLYAPRGPVCYPDDAMTIAALKEGVDSLAKQHRAYAFSCDPDVLMQNTAFIDTMKKLGFRHSYGPTGFEGIQARYNYRTYLNGCTEEEMFARLGQSTRRKVRIAMRKGVEIFVSGPEHLDDFVRIMRITGERDGFAVRPKAYFERFLAAMGEHARLYMGLCEGQVVCGAIAVNFAKKCCYVYGASDSIFRDAMPNYLMQWEMMRWAIQTGCDTYDFQGVSGNLSEENNPLFGLYRFKRGFPGQIDELVGEFDAVYRPVLFAAVEKAAAAAKGLRRLRHRRREG